MLCIKKGSMVAIVFTNCVCEDHYTIKKSGTQ